MSETADHRVAENLDVVVVGAGFSGLYALHQLREEGFAARLFEAGDDVGGTWYWNRYPGARCDVESFDYSYSFSPELEQEWEWTERFATQPEIHQYLRYVADRFDLRRDIELSTRVTAMTYDDELASWHIHTDAGHYVLAQFCVMATGPLSVPIAPDIPGLPEFTGRLIHTSDWPTEPVDFTGRRVAIIGTGSSGVQVVPLIAAQADQCVVVQRTANYVVPARNRSIDPETQTAVKQTYRQRRERARASSSGYIKESGTRNALEVSDEERTVEYERRWAEGGTGIMSSFADLKTSLDANHTLAEFLHAKIRETVTDPAVAERLIPPGYPVGAKRLCVGTDYYETFNRANVELVDLRDEALEGVVPTGLRTSKRTIEVDDLVLATGFDAMTGALTRIDPRGRDGMTLAEEWAGGPSTYLGLAKHGFPNMFLIAGAGSPSVLANVVTAAEQQVDWTRRCLVHLRDHGYRSIEASADAESDWVTEGNTIASHTLFYRAKSWYLGANVPGKPQIFMPYAGGFPRYTAICDDVAADDYRGFVRK